MLTCIKSGTGPVHRMLDPKWRSLIEKMRVATFNLENLGSRFGDADAFEERLSILRPQLERLRADILCLQEINAMRTQPGGERNLIALERLLEGSQYRSYHCVSTHHPETLRPADRHNLAILSRWPVDDSKQFHHTFVQPPKHRFHTAEPAEEEARMLEWDRPILYARIVLPDGLPLDIINVHLKAPLAAAVPGQKLDKFAWKSASGWAEGYYIAAVKRAGQALEVRMFIDRLFDGDPEAEILVVGDFNAEEREVPMRIIAADLEDTGNGRLAKRALVPLERHCSDPQRFTIIHRGRKTAFDHMLASRRLLARFQDMEIHNEALGDELVAFAAIDDSPESYHAPMVASFRDD